MELIFWWVLPAALVMAGAAVWWGLRQYKAGNARRRPVAHGDRLTALPEYQAAVRRYRRWLLVMAVAAGLLVTACTVAAARPAERSNVRPEQHNRDIVLCLDASGSMSSADSAVVETFGRLAQEFDGERIGLTIFDSTAVQVFPLTDDYEYVAEQLKEARRAFDGESEAAGFLDGTWGGEGSSLIGDGLASCVRSFPKTDGEPGAVQHQSSQQRSRSIILATDNYLSGNPIFTLDEAGALALESGVRIYALNPGDYDFGGDPGQPGAQLRSVAEKTNGGYYVLDDPDAVAGIIHSVQATEASRFQGSPRAVVADQAEVPLAIALLSGLVLAGASWRLKP
ncbi:vWA domain-containing protein [Arthrobacter rhizosphaerae]|uniref:vWA domain-containing protein n=1 Tax=Arthrobacter rhizosphaerae TaxID=2855490 RepID=UPI001FF3AF8B|nr:VWA domain-containing protein [Arthrobacter rhizosphaerae]